MSNGNGPSSAQAYIDAALGTVESVIGSLTGNTNDEQDGEAMREQARKEYEESQSQSTSGAVAKDDGDRTAGSRKQTVGSAKESVGGLVGSQNLKTAGREQNVAGQKQEARGQASDLASGASDRVKGTVGGAVASATGNDDKAAAGFQKQREQGKAQQRGAEKDIQQQSK